MSKYYNHFKNSIIISILSLIISFKEELNSNNNLSLNESIEFWLTDPKNNIKFIKQNDGAHLGLIDNQNSETITINSDNIYQIIDGYGFALTGGSAFHIYNLSDAKRNELLTELFDTTNTNIGVSYLRISIGSSDLDRYVFSYNDLDPGEVDLELTNFTIEEDEKYLIPVIKEIIEIAPDIKILASPWSPPIWMKTNNNSIGGSLKIEFYEVYANYFIKYIKSMKNKGINIDAITIQNEPLHLHNNPSLFMRSEEQANFIKNHLGPNFLTENINTKIIIYDHNADRIDYPISILNDEEARQYIDGSAFHLYGGDINDLSIVHMTHPDKNLYFTEQWISAQGTFSEDLKWHAKNLLIGASRNWCKTIIEWNLASDENQDPHTPGGCNQCLGALTITDDNYIKNTAFYLIAHISKYVRPGSKRIYSTSTPSLPNVSFLRTDNKIVLIILNDSNSFINFNIKYQNYIMNSGLYPGALGTYVWDYTLN